MVKTLFRCPVCGSGSLRMLLDVGERPLSVCQLQPTAEESLALPTYDIVICMCRRCTHVFNVVFDPEVKQYDSAGCTMYNDGARWKTHIRSTVEYVDSIRRRRVIEIGAGDGSFLSQLNGEKLAYEPSDDSEKIRALGGISVVRDYFDPFRYSVDEGDLVVMRHVLEHIYNPFEFLDALTAKASELGVEFNIFIEVPCVTNAVRDVRIEDWTYEHPNHFTEGSLRTLLMRTGFRPVRIYETYGGEVLCAHAVSSPPSPLTDMIDHRFINLRDLKLEIDKPVVFWGGAGKSTMMLHKLARDFDKVVDSDERKWGKYVPGLPLRIESPDIIKDTDEVIITTNWREQDILSDMRKRGLSPAVVYTVKYGTLNVSKN